jgi:uncharacterized protein (DUF305 family)
MRRPVSVLTAALALALAIATLAPRVALGAAATPAVVAAVPFDQRFIDMMVPHHQGAEAMARLALTRATHPQIKRLARSIIVAQTKEIAQMRAWRRAWYGSGTKPDMAHMPGLPGLTMHMDMMGAIDRLKTATPFDKAFINAMIPHHQMAIAAARLELARGTHAQLKALALSIIEDQAREIGLMEAYRDLWYGPGAHHMTGM